MTAARQDAWNNDEDLVLAEVVLRHIREGSTQLAAFEEVGKKLTRTAAACGFRWNSYVRKQYGSSVEFAKKQRKGTVEGKKSIEKPESITNQISDKTPAKSQIPFQDVISYLTKIQDVYNDYENLKAENENLKNDLVIARKELMVLQEENQRYTERFNVMEKDYKALIEIMDRAREIVT